MKATLKNLIASSNIPEALIVATVDQFGGWDSFTETAQDVANNGIDGGYGDFIYYSDTVPFAEKNRAEIAKLAESQAADFGEGVLDMVQGFGCLGKDYEQGEIARCLYGSGDDTQILNALA